MLIPSELVDAVAQRKIILFLGSGISAQLGLPDWDSLIASIATECGYDPEVFEVFGTHLELAEFYSLQVGHMGRLRSRLDQQWHEGKDVTRSVVHRLFPQLQAQVVYTTNYDCWIERTYEKLGIPHARIAELSDLKSVTSQQVEIVKLHGDFSQDDSIVLTESSYFDRLISDGPLDLKFRADFVGKSVLFLGYSLSDLNIRLITHKIASSWSHLRNRDSRPRSFITMHRPNPVQTAIFKNRGIETVILDDRRAEGGVALVDFLKSLVQDSFGSVVDVW